jgi:hypothetical protein
LSRAATQPGVPQSEWRRDAGRIESGWRWQLETAAWPSETCGRAAHTRRFNTRALERTAPSHGGGARAPSGDAGGSRASTE